MANIETAAQLNDMLDQCGGRLLLRQQPSPAEKQRVCAALCDLFLGHFQFLPDEPPFRSPVRTLTGETLDSATRRTYVTMESLRLLKLLGGGDPNVRKVLWAAGRMALCGVLVYREKFWAKGHAGMYCCGPCTAAFWRAMQAGVFHPKVIDRGRWEADGLTALHAHRRTDGQWRAFPFFYTLLALSGMRSAAARDEKRFVARRCEEFLKNATGATVHQARRRKLAECVLGQA